MNTPPVTGGSIPETGLNPVNMAFQPPTAEPSANFQAAYCSRLGLAPAAFEKQVLLASLPRYYRPFGVVMWLACRGYFQPDLLLIRAVADCTSVNQVIAEVNYLHKTVFPRQGLARGLLRFRVSGSCVIKFAKQFLPAR
ncbi:MAG: hypothetical protein WCS94_14845 [Verrucomicrobiota bacterium]